MRKATIVLLAVAAVHCGRAPVHRADPDVAAPRATLTESEPRVESPARTTLLGPGDPAPAFRAVAHDGRRVEVGPFARPRALIVYFYPRDETPGCTREAEAFRDEQRVYEAAGADVVGVSTDTLDAHRAFAANHGLQFSLVSDPQGRIAAAFGVEVSGGAARRTTFVINRTGHVARAFPAVRVEGHADEVATAVREAH